MMSSMSWQTVGYWRRFMLRKKNEPIRRNFILKLLKHQKKSMTKKRFVLTLGILESLIWKGDTAKKLARVFKGHLKFRVS